MEAPSASFAKPPILGDFAAVDLPGLLPGIGEACSEVTLTKAVSAAGFTAVAVPSVVDSTEAALVVAATAGAAAIAEVTERGAAMARLT